MEGSKINNRYRFGVVVYLHCLPAVAARAPQAHLHLHTWLVFERNYRRFYHSIRSQERASISDGSWRWLANSTDWLLMMLDTNGLDTRMISMLMILQFIAVHACYGGFGTSRAKVSLIMWVMSGDTTGENEDFSFSLIRWGRRRECFIMSSIRSIWRQSHRAWQSVEGRLGIQANNDILMVAGEQMVLRQQRHLFAIRATRGGEPLKVDCSAIVSISSER